MIGIKNMGGIKNKNARLDKIVRDFLCIHFMLSRLKPLIDIVTMK